ncbi:hypothetical protein ACHAPJ_008327 [Fusarium lateritium]
MKVITHDIHPDGDLYIILKDPNSLNLEPELRLCYHTATDSCFILDPASLGRAWTFPGLPNLKGLKKTPTAIPSIELSNDEPIQVRLRVSSCHLTLASPVFKKMLQGPWSEATPQSVSPTSSTSPSREITATGWNAHALVVVLNIIHCQNHGVPKKVSPSFLAHIAVIVDYYQCDEAILVAVEMWKKECFHLPKVYGKEAIVWLYIGWAFSSPDLFSKMARFIVQRGQGLEFVKTNNLPVAAILDKVDEKRREVIDRILAGLDDLAEKLMNSEGCGHECSSMMLGALMRERKKMNQLDLPLTSPFTGYSVTHVQAMVKGFRSTKWSTPEQRDGVEHQCTIQKKMQHLFYSDSDDKDIRLPVFNISRAYESSPVGSGGTS